MQKTILNVLVTFVFLTNVIGNPTTGNAQSKYQKLTFSDEFEGANGSAVDPAKWTAESGGGGWGNQELEYYTASTENAFLDGKGFLNIKAIKLAPSTDLNCWNGPCQYTSARLITKGKFDQKYGRFEARLKIPRGQGMWPAFWMLGSNIDKFSWPECGEIDVMENIGREPKTVHGTIHGPGYSGGNGIGGPFSLPTGEPFADDFHIYSTEWNDSSIRFFADGKLYKTIRMGDIPTGSRWVYDHPFFMILNLAVGGPWGGSPDSTSVFPQTMMVDYVRAYGR